MRADIGAWRTLASGKLGVSGVRCLVRPAIGSDLAGVLCGLTFELSWHRRWDARARLAKMYSVPPTGPAWPAVGAQLERGVRQRCARCETVVGLPRPCYSSWHAACASRSALTTVACHVFKPPHGMRKANRDGGRCGGPTN